MATINAVSGLSAGPPLKGARNKFFILENTVDLDSLNVASGDVVQVLPVKAGFRVFGTEVEIVKASDAETSATATIGDGDDTDGFDTNINLKASVGTVASTGMTLVTGTPNTLQDAYAGTGKRYLVDDTIDLIPTYSGATSIKGKVKVRAWGCSV